MPRRSATPAGASWGADVDGLERAASGFFAAADALDAIARRLSARLDEAGSAWRGRDAVVHLQAARRTVTAIARMGGAMVRCGRALRRQAAEQRRASSPAPAVTVERRSTRGDGRIVRRVGPASAGAVVVVVPGVGNDLGDADRLLDDAVRVQSAAWVRHGLGDVAVVSWLGYDPPDVVAGGLDPRPARRGAARLGADVRRWRRDGAERIVLVGHSYGALVVGRTAAAGSAPTGSGGMDDPAGRQVDALVQLGAPGAGPPGPTAWRALRRPGLAWWAARAPGDPIAFAQPWVVGVHGPDPVRLADRVATTGRGHGGYLRDPEVLRAVAQVAGAGGHLRAHGPRTP